MELTSDMKPLVEFTEDSSQKSYRKSNNKSTFHGTVTSDLNDLRGSASV